MDPSTIAAGLQAMSGGGSGGGTSISVPNTSGPVTSSTGSIYAGDQGGASQYVLLLALAGVIFAAVAIGRR